MKYISLILLFAIALLFAACDGRDRLHKTPQEILHETELLDSFSENITFIPNGYAEKVTDTIFNNGYRIHIKMYSDMENHVSITSGKDTTNYRNFNLDIKVIKEGVTLLDSTFNKQSEKIVEKFSINLETYYLRDFWITEDNEAYENVPSIYFEFYSPKTKESSIIEIVSLEENTLFFTH